ncbi:Mitochondrial inner membrane protease atp23 [Tilletia horrida]|uniref:Mitochondrial inner membrane protease ATP23 n=1 Tax=Tilletia horrida TaxID=155126 RepID=A0AAN6GMA3_9BASI|nr:Mitochondrial inner membrane protease atp23 [Tilletia horrida]KAK0554647.1 Mitochondrial inner membrane protease atp23 [Tilletia horrida]KAK0563261.1 Mitochondrial inner membrane protease atp23 [Tilletia horrida]
MSTYSQGRSSSGSASASKAYVDPNFKRWLKTCSAAFPTQDSIPLTHYSKLSSPCPPSTSAPPRWIKRAYPHGSGRIVANSAADTTSSSPLTSFWSSVSSAWGSSAPESDEARRKREAQEEQQHRERLEKWGIELAQYSPMIVFLSKHLNMLSCNPYSKPDPNYIPDDLENASQYYAPVSPLGRIIFVPCDANRAGGFQEALPPHESGIVICSNRVKSKNQMEQVLAHEMIHWFDHCRFHVNWDNLRHRACSEIRASALSGECKFAAQFAANANIALLKNHQVCTRRRAALSVSGADSLSHLSKEDREVAVQRVMDEVWEACWNDTRPFDEIY